MGSLFGGDKQKLGLKYHVGLHTVLCYGPVDNINEIRIGERQVFTGTALDQTTLVLDKPDLFGGEKREGGVGGGVDIEFGTATQGVNAYLLDKLPRSTIPAFRGVVSMVWKQFYWGNNPYLKSVAIRVKRTLVQTDGQPMWYSAKADIGGSMNAAHIIRECLTNPFWGMGESTGNIDDANFIAAADRLFTEGFGLNLLWANAEPIDDFITNIERHVNCTVAQDPKTNRWRIKLIRDDYVLADLPVFDESNVSSLESFQRAGWGETVNEVSVVYRDNSDADGQKDKTITVQDIANVQVQGVRIGRTVNLQGIGTASLATRVAFRELRILASPLSKITIITNRDAVDLIIGEVFKFNWPDLGIIDGVYRIVVIDYGSVRDHKIKVEAVEDVFSLDDATYVTPQPGAWLDPRNTAIAVVNQQAVEATYWEIIQNISQADIHNFDPDAGFAIAHATRPTPDSYDFDLWTRIGSASFVKQRPGDFASYCETLASIKKTSNVIDYQNDADMDLVPIGIYAYLGTEIVAVTALDLIHKTVTVNRGVIDTVPQSHLAGAKMFFIGNFMLGFDATERVVGQTVAMKMLPSTGRGTLDIASATAAQVTMNNRFQRPYPPSAPFINGVLLQEIASGQQVYLWRHRDRTQQTVTFTQQTDADIGPEAGVTYDVELYDENGTLRNSQLGISANTYTWSDADEKAQSALIEPDSQFEGTYVSVVNADNPTAYWRLGDLGAPYTDETANHDLTHSGTASTFSIAGAIVDDANTAVDFNGGWGTTANHADFDSNGTDFSAELWFNTTLTTSTVMFSVRAGPVTLLIEIFNGVVQARTWQFATSASTVSTNPATFKDGHWHHAAVTYNNTTGFLTLYVDGVQKDTKDQAGAVARPSGNQSPYVASNIGVQNYVDPLDEVAWYKGTRLTAAQVSEHFRAAKNSAFRVNDEIRVTLKSKRDGFDSIQSHDHTYTRTGWGLRWDQYWNNKP